MRAVVFKTKGKLDLRSITTFGLNAKPETTNPIGYFGTGLKYAIAVLAREKIPLTFWIDGKQWVIERDPSTFRGKEFTELYICSTTVGGLIKKRIKLPFTTELGKNWKLWQAFRELESNTRDENGQSGWVEFAHKAPQLNNIAVKGHTSIVVESELFVNEWFERDKTFLKDGLTQRDGSEAIQVFDAPSKSIYYRSIRIFDLPEKKHALLTYNILEPLELTEDRTAKSSYDINWKIQHWVATHAPEDIIKTVLRAPEGALERDLYFDYTTPSKTFVETLTSIPRSSLSHYGAQAYAKYAPKKETIKGGSWQRSLVEALKDQDYDLVNAVIRENQEALIQLLEADHAKLPLGTDKPAIQEEVDDIPF